MENLNNVSKAISSKNLIPILSGIKFDNRNKYNMSFENTKMYNFLNSYMINDMIYQSIDYKMRVKTK